MLAAEGMRLTKQPVDCSKASCQHAP
jgi:hypothetical protein